MESVNSSLDVKNLTLITGGARSGKSAFAEALANADGGRVLYVATMEEVVDDKEAVERIQRHRQRRPTSWKTIEIPFEVDRAVAQMPVDTEVCLLDCLSLYVSNMLLKLEDKSTTEQLEEQVFDAAARLLVEMQVKAETRFIVVTNEVGWGIVPEHKLARTYRDLLGLVNQQFARAAGQVWLSCAGLQVKLK